MLGFPSSFVAGDDIEFLSTLDDYSSTDYSLSFAIVGAASIDSTTISSGQGWKTTITAANSDVTAGVYQWSASVVKDGKRKTVGSGRVTVTANFADLTTLDGRTLNEKILESIQAAIHELVSLRKGITQLSIEGRSQSYDLAGLQSLETTYRGLVAQERRLAAIAAGKGDPSFKKIMFVD